MESIQVTDDIRLMVANNIKNNFKFKNIDNDTSEIK